MKLLKRLPEKVVKTIGEISNKFSKQNSIIIKTKDIFNLEDNKGLKLFVNIEKTNNFFRGNV